MYICNRTNNAMALRTNEQLKELFLQSKLSQQKKKEREKQRYKKASESIKKALNDKSIKEQKQSQQKPLKQVKRVISISIYNSNLIEREQREEDLFQTREELQQWEKENYQCINWDVWDRLVKEGREKIRKYL